jgi:DNA-binding GntR family transcriptional regulator
MCGYQTKQEFVYQTVRREIMSGKLKPGSRLTFSGLAQRLGVSESPVREAVKRLATKGLL